MDEATYLDMALLGAVPIFDKGVLISKETATRLTNLISGYRVYRQFWKEVEAAWGDAHLVDTDRTSAYGVSIETVLAWIKGEEK